MKDMFFVAYVVKEGSISELSRDAFASRRMRAIARKFEAEFRLTRILHPYFNFNGHALRLHRVPRAAVAVASVKIVLSTVAVETVVVVEPVVSAAMPKASVVKEKTIGCR